MHDLKVTMSTGSFSVDNLFRNALAVKFSDLIEKVEVLNENRSVFVGSHAVLVVVD